MTNKQKKKAARNASVKDGERVPVNFVLSTQVLEELDAIAKSMHVKDRHAALRNAIHSTAEKIAAQKPRASEVAPPEKTKRVQFRLFDSDLQAIDKIDQALVAAGVLDDSNQSAAIRYAIGRAAPKETKSK